MKEEVNEVKAEEICEGGGEGGEVTYKGGQGVDTCLGGDLSHV